MLFLTKEELQITSPLQALYFYATWMPFHTKFLTMISKVEDKYKDVEFLAIDVDQFKTQCVRFNVESIPSVLIFKNGQEVKRITGLTLTSAFKSAFADICTS